MKYLAFDLLDGLQISHFVGGYLDVWKANEWRRCLNGKWHLMGALLTNGHWTSCIDCCTLQGPSHPSKHRSIFTLIFRVEPLPLYAFYLMQKSWGAFIMSSVTVTFLRLHKTSLVKVNSFGKSHKECKSQPGRSCLSFVTFADLCKNCPFHGGKDMIFWLE